MNYTELNNEITKAMKARDNDRRDALRAVLNEVKNIEVNERRVIEDDDVDAMVKKVMKQTKESYDASVKAANNDERTCFLLRRIEILDEYMPQILDMSTGLNDCIDKMISENFDSFSKKDIGKAMKVMSDKYGVSFDKKQAADYLKSISN